jgi:chromosome segregation ATPase
MRTILIIAWLFLGLGAAIYHYGPGQKRVAMDGIENVLAEARTNVSLEKYPQALVLFDKAMAELSVDNEDLAHRIQLEKAKAQMHAAQLPEARASLGSLLSRLRSAESPDEKLISETQQALANAQYYRTWLMRLEGQPEEAWKPEIEAARQHFTQLNEKSVAAGDTEAAEKTAEDLEATVRLARMDLNDLQGLPLPNQ